MAAQNRQNKVGIRSRHREKKAESEGDDMQPLKETNAGRNLTGRPQPCGNTQIDKNGLI